MGGALIRGWIAAGAEAADLVIIDPHPGEDARSALDAGASGDSADLARAGMVVMAVKPQVFPDVAPGLAAHIRDDAALLSIMAGTSVAELERAFPGRSVLRAMPNTPASVGQGITGLFAPDGTADDLVARARELLSVCGPVLGVADESDIDRVTAISGSGPAYVFHMVEALAGAGAKLGLSPGSAMQLARETVRGAAALLDTGEAADLRRAVTSPNGTTQAALEVLMAELPDLMERTARAAFDRARELGES